VFGNFLVAEQLTASQEGLSSIQLVIIRRGPYVLEELVLSSKPSRNEQSYSARYNFAACFFRFLPWFTLRPWRWKRCILSKLRVSPNYTSLQLRRAHSSLSLPWEPQIQHFVIMPFIFQIQKNDNHGTKFALGFVLMCHHLLLWRNKDKLFQTQMLRNALEQKKYELLVSTTEWPEKMYTQCNRGYLRTQVWSRTEILRTCVVWYSLKRWC
jgi:hypothetical protein